jgi:hypothetical protein
MLGIRIGKTQNLVFSCHCFSKEGNATYLEDEYIGIFYVSISSSFIYVSRRSGSS